MTTRRARNPAQAARTTGPPTSAKTTTAEAASVQCKTSRAVPSGGEMLTANPKIIDWAATNPAKTSRIQSPARSIGTSQEASTASADPGEQLQQELIEKIQHNEPRRLCKPSAQDKHASCAGGFPFTEVFGRR
jgi:hypothetical protein